MGDMSNEIKLLTGNSHPALAHLVADRFVLDNSGEMHATGTDVMRYQARYRDRKDLVSQLFEQRDQCHRWRIS